MSSSSVGPVGVQPSSSRVRALEAAALGAWIAEGEDRSFAAIQRSVLDELRTLVA